MSDIKPFTLFMLFIMFYTIGFFSGIGVEHQLFREQAIEHNCGQYNPKSGEFEWKDNT